MNKLPTLPDLPPGTWLDTKAAAKALSVSPKTLEAWRVRTPPKGPEFLRVGNSVRYPIESLHQFLIDSFVPPQAVATRLSTFTHLQQGAAT